MCTCGAKVLFSISSMIRGYHVYKDIWEATEGDLFPWLPIHLYRVVVSMRKFHDPFSVTVVKNDHIFGHMPKKSQQCVHCFCAEEGV